MGKDITNKMPDWVKPVIFLLLLGMIIVIGKKLDFAEDLDYAAIRIELFSWYGIAIFIGLIVLGSVLLVPGSILIMSAGFIFGFWKGLAIASLSTPFGVTAAFLVGRYFIRGWFENIVKRKSKIKEIDEAISRDGWQIVCLLRLSPIMPINILNYIFGFTRISVKQYILASFVGMMPLVIIYVYLGTLANSVASLNFDKLFAVDAKMQWVYYGLGLLITLLIMIYLTYQVNKKLHKKL